MTQKAPYEVHVVRENNNGKVTGFGPFDYLADAQILAMFRTIDHYAFNGYAAERAAESGIRYAHDKTVTRRPSTPVPQLLLVYGVWVVMGICG
jgi:hypothetical protein